MAGRPPSEKTFANMLRVAIKEAHEEGKDKLRAVADALVSKAMTGDVPAIREVADRLDGKVPQAVIGGDENDPPIRTDNAHHGEIGLSGTASFIADSLGRGAPGASEEPGQE